MKPSFTPERPADQRRDGARKLRPAWLALITGLAALQGGMIARAATFTVTTALDESNGSPDPALGAGTSLREAIQAANGSPGSDIIRFSDGTELPGGIPTTDFLGQAQVIRLQGTNLTISGDVSILGPGPELLALDGNSNGDTNPDPGELRILVITTEVNDILIEGLTFQNARAPRGAPGAGFLSGARGVSVVRDCNFTGNGTNEDGGAIWFGNGTLGTLRIENCTFSNNDAGSGGGAIRTSGNNTTIIENSEFTGNTTRTGFSTASVGGAIRCTNGTLEIRDSVFTANTAIYDGGAINNNRGKLTLERTRFVGNESDNWGGAINCDFGATAVLTDCLIRDSRAAARGGAISSYRNTVVTLRSSTLANNRSVAEGGAIYSGDNATLHILNSTISGNMSQTSGGGIFNGVGTFDSGISNLLLIQTTVVANIASTGSGGGVFNNSAKASATVRNSVVAGNNARTGRDVAGPGFTSNRFNFIGFDNSAGAAFSFDLSFGSTGTSLVNLLETVLADNGGPTPTHALIAGSPLIDSAATSGSTDPGGAPLEFDQRGPGFPRVVAVAADIGAYESGGADLGILVASSLPTVLAGAPATPLVHTVTLTNHGPSAASDIVTLVTADPPPGVAVEATPSVGTFAGGRWQIPALAPGQSATLTRRFAVSSATQGAIEGIVTEARIDSAGETDLVPGNNSGATATSVISPASVGTTTLEASPRLDPQSGLFIHRVTVTNGNPLPIVAIRLMAGGLSPSTTLRNATGSLADGSPYLDSTVTLAPQEAMTFTLEYFLPARNLGFQPTYSVVAIFADPIEPPPAASAGTEVPRIVILPEGSVLIEFPTRPGATYAVEYGDDMARWERVVPQITASANRTQWIDSGPPKTSVHPASVPRRYYRFVETAAPADP
jgi:CSLREA domain-containing protein